MSKIFGWISRNKLLVFLFLVIGYFLIKNSLSSLTPVSSRSIPPPNFTKTTPSGAVSEVGLMAPTPPTERTDRIVIKDTTLSLVVSDVPNVLSEVARKTRELGGFLVNSELNILEGPATGTITVRVPEAKRSEALAEFKKLAVKVVSENISGIDVTDEYVDLEAKLAVLEKTKAKFQTILEGATKVQDLLEVQKELINIQERIDNVKGQQKYLEQSAKLSLITVYLSTDELSLPYTPDQAWRPNVIFKQAVRSLIESLHLLANIIIWITVFTPIWLPIALVIWYLKKRKNNRKG